MFFLLAILFIGAYLCMNKANAIIKLANAHNVLYVQNINIMNRHITSASLFGNQIFYLPKSKKYNNADLLREMITK